MTLNVFPANPGAAKSRSYRPGAPGTTHEVVPASALHWAEPDAAPESVRVRPGTGPPLAEDTRTTMAMGGGHGGLGQSGPVGSLHPIHAPRTTASPRTPRRPSVITLALRLPPTRSAERPRFSRAAHSCASRRRLQPPVRLRSCPSSGLRAEPFWPISTDGRHRETSCHWLRTRPRPGQKHQTVEKVSLRP